MTIAGRRAEATLPIDSPTSAEIEVVQLALGRTIAIVRVQGEGDRAAAALVSQNGGRPQVLWSGHLDLRGDPGERRRDVLEVADRSGDGVDDVIVALEFEGARICGAERTLLATRAVDPASGALRPIELRPLPADDPEVALVASITSPGPSGPPMLPGLAFIRASSSVGFTDDPALATPPVALGDGDPATYWAEGRGGAGRWEFATARYIGNGPIRALALTLAASPVARPTELLLVGDDGPRLRITIPADAPTGVPLFVTPPAPPSWSCLSIVLDSAATIGATGLAEVTVYGDLDFGEGMDTLVEELVADGSAGARAADVLARLGAPARDAVLTAWPTLTATGRRRAVRVLSANATDPAAQRALMEAAGDEDETVRTAAVDALMAGGEAARPALIALVAVPSDAGDRAAETLARISPDIALPALLDAIQAPSGTERPGLRRALRAAYTSGDPQTRDQRLRESFLPEAAAGPVASVTLALAKATDSAEIVGALLARGITVASRFQDRYRLVKAAAELIADGEDDADAWLLHLATDSGEWMLRAEAVAALSARRSPRLPEAAMAALEDPYPRVRATAARAIAHHRPALRAVATLARRDDWPMVRAAATLALAPIDEAVPILLASLGDNKQSVRAAAVLALTQREERGAREAISERLLDDGEWPEVVDAAIEYARALCDRRLVDALVAVMRRGMRHDAWGPDIDVAAHAVLALSEIGGADAEAAVRSASSEGAPGPIRAAAAAAEGAAGPGRCGGSNSP